MNIDNQVTEWMYSLDQNELDYNGVMTHLQHFYRIQATVGLIELYLNTGGYGRKQMEANKDSVVLVVFIDQYASNKCSDPLWAVKVNYGSPRMKGYLRFTKVFSTYVT